MKPLDAYYHALSLTVPRTPLVRSRTLNRTLHGFAYQRLRKPSLGLIRPNATLGWAHVPGQRAVHPSYEFRVTYETDDLGRRVSGYTGTDAQVLLLGCSWAFGHGVEDHESLAAQLSTERHVPTLNYACMGYGPAQAYLQLSQLIDLDAVCGPQGFVIYVWSPDQLIRSWRRREWIELNAWVNPTGASHPVFDIVDGRLTHAGLIDATNSVTDPLLLAGTVERMEWRLTIALIEAMRDHTAKAGRRFAVIVPPVPDGTRGHDLTQQMIARLTAHDVPFLDLTPHGVSSGDSMFYRFDGHPTPAWHATIADALADVLAPATTVLGGRL